ncbi:hypothetical protein V6N11_037705 [Hibiscus sabdariffa]|uniref:Uncharacterized protein n=1 Tax=Hibiscus sabdariffa TaxID=183260 RepID=A0ABR2PC28_9ROSI
MKVANKVNQPAIALGFKCGCKSATGQADYSSRGIAESDTICACDCEYGVGPPLQAITHDRLKRIVMVLSLLRFSTVFQQVDGPQTTTNTTYH